MKSAPRTLLSWLISPPFSCFHNLHTEPRSDTLWKSSGYQRSCQVLSMNWFWKADNLFSWSCIW
jgi:hypothetical protein